MGEEQRPANDLERTTMVACPECGASISLANVRAFLLALHLTQACTETQELRAS